MAIEQIVSIGAELRDWQRSALEDFQAKRRPQDFLISATPGAGKTTMALSLARQLIDDGSISRIVVVVPTDTLRTQWSDNAADFGIDLLPAKDAADYFKTGYHGNVVTYAQLARGVGAESVRIGTQVPLLAIIDEVHHAGDSRSWGEGLQYALEHAKYRTLLTGTPWRQDKASPIPFVKYDDAGKVVVDYPYEYGRAVGDGVCRRVEFHAYDGKARWHDCGIIAEGSLGAELADEDVSVVLDAALDPYQPWIRTLLTKADEALNDVRMEIPDLGGLVVADTQWHAREYRRIMQAISGETPVVVISDDPTAKEKIEQFRSSRDRWIIAVRMVSEGVDIPRLAVGVYATKARTPLIFRQIAGRIWRTRKDEEINAQMLMPAVPALMAHGREIEQELRHEIDLEREISKTERSRESQPPLSLREVLSATEAIFDRTIVGGEDLSQDEILIAQAECRAMGIPPHYAANVARWLRNFNPTMPAAAATLPATPQHRTEKLLRSEAEQLARRLARKRQCEVRDVNREILGCGYPPRGKAAIADLEGIISYLESEIARHGR